LAQATTTTTPIKPPTVIQRKENQQDLTGQNPKTLRHQQNVDSKRIYKDKREKDKREGQTQRPPAVTGRKGSPHSQKSRREELPDGLIFSCPER
jgi:hypothetical protein